MTRLCVALFVDDAAQARRDAAGAAEAGADMVELRIDGFASADEAGLKAIEALVRDCPLPSIVTCRAPWEGGRGNESDADRVAKLGAAVRAGTSYIDIEHAALSRSAEALAPLGFPPAASPAGAIAAPREKRAGIILSSHDFHSRPAHFNRLLAELADRGADVDKIVWTARTVRDNLEAFELLQHRNKPTIALCMGEAGLISRVLARKFGAFLSFACLSSDAETAPGQVALHDMKRLYRWDAIGPATKVYGVVGQPVAHSMSPAIHNAAFEQAGHDGIYLPFLVNAGYESFKAFMESFLHAPGLDLAGLSVTIPHKENALRFLLEKGSYVDPLAARIGAVNTIVVDRGSDWPALRGFSTDYAAILDCITDALGESRADLVNHRVAVFGAGGTGRTATAALAHYGVAVFVHNRTPARAEALAAEFNGQSGQVKAVRLDALADQGCGIFINTTSAGMHPNVETGPLDDLNEPLPFSSGALVFDAVYNPIQTKLLRQAEAAGARTINGVEMFVRQAAGQFERWTAQPAPVPLMRRIVLARLGSG